MERETIPQIIQIYGMLTVAALLGAFSVVTFLVPANLVPTGTTGAAVLFNELTGFPVGIMSILINIPILALGYRMLPGGWRVTVRTVFVVTVLSLAIDVLTYWLPAVEFTDDRFLNAIFGGIISGVAGGLVYRTGTNFGGTSTLSLIMQRKFGMPLSNTILYTDTAIIAAAGVVFGVEAALYATVVLFVGAAAADYTMEGPSVVRTATVISDHPNQLAKAVMKGLGRSVTHISAQGGYSRNERPMLYIAVSRSQVKELRDIIAFVDPSAFVVIEHAHTAYGNGFKAKPRNVKLPEPLKTQQAQAEVLAGD